MKFLDMIAGLMVGLALSKAQRSGNHKGGEDGNGATEDEAAHENSTNTSRQIRAVNESLRALANDYNADRGERKSEHAKDRKLTFWTTVGVWVYTFITALIMVGTIYQAVVSRQALITVQRAFAFVSSLNYRPVSLMQQGREGWLLYPVWENSGSTPTRNLRIYAEATTMMHDEIEKFEFKIPQGTKFTPVVIGPHSTIFGSSSFIERDAVENLGRLEKPSVIAWAEAHYRDVFKVKRVTKYCLEFYGISRRQDGQVELFSQFCPVHNCTDDECERQDREARSRVPERAPHDTRSAP